MKLKDIGVTPLIEMSAGGTTSAGSIASVMAPLGKMITRRKKRKDKNPSIYGGPPEENVLFAEGSARPEYHNTQVKGSDATPKAKPGRTKHPFKGKLVGASAFSEGDMEADREAGIKWVDDPNWKLLHEMNPDMVKDFLEHKGNVAEKRQIPATDKTIINRQHFAIIAEIIGMMDPDSLPAPLRNKVMAHFMQSLPTYNKAFDSAKFKMHVIDAAAERKVTGGSEPTDDDKEFDAEFKASSDRIARDAVGDDTTLTPFKYSNKKESIRTERKLSADEKKRENITQKN
jgi:hypothetical protein